MSRFISYGQGFEVMDGPPCGCVYVRTDDYDRGGGRWLTKCPDRAANGHRGDVCDLRGLILNCDVRITETHGDAIKAAPIPGHRTVKVEGVTVGALVRSAGRWRVALTAWHGTDHGSFHSEAHAARYVRDIITEEGPRVLARA